MGNSSSVFTEQELDDYKELTYFTKREILYVHELFKSLASGREIDGNTRLPTDDIVKLEELKVNPFNDQMCKVFSSQNDGTMSFEDFLDMMSVFSDNAPRVIKTEYAFRIYDFDGDDFIGTEDLKEILNRLTGNQKLSEDNLDIIVANIMEEADMDKDNMLAFAEFEHIISKAPDFMKYF